MPYDMGTLVNESYDTTDYFVYSILLPVVFDAPVGIPRQLWHDVVSAINSGQITTYSGLDAMLTSGVTVRFPNVSVLSLDMLTRHRRRRLARNAISLSFAAVYGSRCVSLEDG